MSHDLSPEKKEQMIDSFLNRLKAELMAADVYFINMENHGRPIHIGPFSPYPVWPTMDKHPLTFTFCINHHPYQVQHPMCRCMPDVLK